MKKYRYQSVLLTIPSGANANSLVEQQMNLDPGYNVIRGVMMNVIDSATLGNNLLLGCRSDQKKEMDLTPVAAWNANDQAGVSPVEKFFPLGEGGAGIGYGANALFYAQATPLASPGADVQIYMTLWLEKELAELPNI